MSCPKMTTERGGGGRGVAVSEIDFVWTLIKFIETIFAFGLQDDLTMITRLVQLALVGGIVRGKAVWDSHCHNKHCQGNPVRCSSPSCHNSLIYEYGQYVHPALKKLFYQGQWKQLWWLHQQEEIHRTNWILLSKRCFSEQYHQLKMSQKIAWLFKLFARYQTYTNVRHPLSSTFNGTTFWRGLRGSIWILAKSFS